MGRGGEAGEGQTMEEGALEGSSRQMELGGASCLGYFMRDGH